MRKILLQIVPAQLRSIILHKDALMSVGKPYLSYLATQLSTVGDRDSNMTILLFFCHTPASEVSFFSYTASSELILMSCLRSNVIISDTSVCRVYYMPHKRVPLIKLTKNIWKLQIPEFYKDVNGYHSSMSLVLRSKVLSNASENL